MPSLYRPLIDAGRGFERNNITSLYNRGRYFYQTLTNATPVDHFRRQFSFGKALLGLFGLPFGLLFAQHCCVPTEGLDVTQDPEIAGLFSIYDYANAHYFDAFDELGVIYRITVPHSRFDTLDDIKGINDFSLPFYLDGTRILGLIEECATIEEAISAYREFQFEDWYLKTQTDIELENYRFHRPLEILRMPPRELAQGRVFKQKAGLIFPDLIFEKKFDPRPAENEGTLWQGPLCVEDLSKAECVEIFLFRHSHKNRQVIDLDPDLLFPTKDPIKSMLSRVLSGLYGVRLLNWDREQAVPLSAGDEDSLIR